MNQAIQDAINSKLGYLYLEELYGEEEIKQALREGLTIKLEDDENSKGSIDVYIRRAYGMEMAHRGGYPDCPWVAVRSAIDLADDKLFHCQSYEDAVDAAYSFMP